MLNFNADAKRPDNFDLPAWWFVFNGRKILVLVDPENSRDIKGLPQIKSPAELYLTTVRNNFLGEQVGVGCWVADFEGDTELPAGLKFVNPRFLFGQINNDLMRVVAKSIFVSDWDRDNQFCGRCSTPMKYGTDRSKICPNCKLTRYARISPAVIMLVRNGDKLLLGRNERHPNGFYSILAGFVDPGESLEETVAREVKEEVGLEVKNITYFGSESWPFPDSLMVGFVCDYAGGEIVLEDEIIEANWYGIDELPANIPSGKISIAGQLIEWFISENS
ncbi:MAG: NAD+ diphosphatase [Cellvibrionaceae bacterium]|jgi:NAD+ diphosphatase